MGMFNLQAAIYTNEAREETLTNELTDNSMDLRLRQKHSSNDVQAIRDKYAPEKDRINNEIEDLDKTEQREEYQDLISELKELKDQEESEVEKIENETNDYETIIQTENESLEVQIEEISASTETFQEMLKQSIESEFGYFQ